MCEKLVSIDQGLLKGTSGTDINGKPYFAFLGIPYAKPPIGKLRFKAPQPPDKWAGVLNATKDGHGCYCRNFVSRTIAGSEDCLFVNVFTSQLPEEKPVLKPVMVYIHGGAFKSGSNTSEIYGPEFLLTGDIVLVVINYRIGLLGFLQIDDPEAGVPGNAGGKDIVMALKWVQSNIKYFGGDSDNVTIFGESAGGALVHLLVLSPMGKGLFHKAIAQSGCALNTWCVAKPTMAELMKAFSCPYKEGKAILRYLQELSVEKILEGQEKIQDDFTASFRRAIGPVIEQLSPNETAFLCEEPLDTILDGRYIQVPLMMGYTSREGIFFEMLDKKWNRKQIVDDFEKMVPHSLNLEKSSELSQSIANKIKTFYFGNEAPSYENVEKSCLVQSDNMFVHGIWMSIKNHALTSKFPVYFYRFSVDADLNYYKKQGDLKQPGASHADDLGYLFKMISTRTALSEDSIELKTVRRMVRLWTNFAKTGDPNPIENIAWKAMSKDDINILDIGTELTYGPNPDQDRIAFWDCVFNEAYNFM